MRNEMKFYKRMIICTDGSLYEGRWSRSKKEYMRAADRFIRSGMKAVGMWEAKEIDLKEFNMFWEDEKYEEEDEDIDE